MAYRLVGYRLWPLPLRLERCWVCGHWMLMRRLRDGDPTVVEWQSIGHDHPEVPD